ncbi:hypothetical protein CAPTEDRAFT_204961 [Capitella teleta]|uniref:Uncharacterized protein n=1 Tax=Capitella teleta TaxID=283909 RepID=R7U5H4_CAPTE|nr:hypothetical protein CAPTEDRAFT_204961 [Capitella teleta]|eukprot:ELT98380.1 hypothetical protein CAPTEDRAFT_204961 [Capitella teleta]
MDELLIKYYMDELMIKYDKIRMTPVSAISCLKAKNCQNSTRISDHAVYTQSAHVAIVDYLKKQVIIAVFFGCRHRLWLKSEHISSVILLRPSYRNRHKFSADPRDTKPSGQTPQPFGIPTIEFGEYLKEINDALSVDFRYRRRRRGNETSADVSNLLDYGEKTDNMKLVFFNYIEISIAATEIYLDHTKEIGGSGL